MGTQLVTPAPNRCWFSLSRMFWKHESQCWALFIRPMPSQWQSVTTNKWSIKPTTQHHPTPPTLPSTWSAFSQCSSISIISLVALLTSALCVISKQHLLPWVLPDWKSCGGQLFQSGRVVHHNSSWLMLVCEVSRPCTQASAPAWPAMSPFIPLCLRLNNWWLLKNKRRSPSPTNSAATRGAVTNTFSA